MRDPLPGERQRAFVVRRRLAVVREFGVCVAEQHLPAREPVVAVPVRGLVAELERAADVLDRVAVGVASERLHGGALKIFRRSRVFPRALPVTGELAEERFEASGVVLLEGGRDRRVENPPLRERQEVIGNLLADGMAKFILRPRARSERPQSSRPTRRSSIS